MSKNEIHLYGSVGNYWWDEDYFTAASVRAQLEGRSGPLDVRINSGGGIATEGQAIYTMLVDYPDQVNVIIDGVAASAASLIAMAGDTITMRLGSYMLIHDPANPWTEGRGTEADHLQKANELRITSGAYAAIYALKSGKSKDAAREVMKAETLLDGDMAVAEGFASATDDTMQASAVARFDYRMYAHAPQAWRDASERLGKTPGRTAVMAMIAGTPRKPQESEMTVETAVTAQADDTAITMAADMATEVTKAVAAGVEKERVRGVRIREAVMVAKLAPAFAEDLVARGVSVDAALTEITAKWKAEGDVDTAMTGRETAKVTADARDKFIAGATMSLLGKSRLKGGERNEFSSMSLKELARESIAMSGERRTFMDPREMVGYAFTMAGGAHSTSDFANILANVQGKAALQGWEEAEETFEMWTRKGTLTDFKPTTRVGAGLFPALPKVGQGADYTYVTVGDRGEPIMLATYGAMLRITRQAIINDDLSILSDLPRKMGRAAKATIGDMVYAVLTANAAMSDGVALFAAGHNNLQTGAPSALSVTSLSTGEAAMRVQKEGTRVLNVGPKYLLVPAALKLAANQLLNSTVDPRDNKGHAANPVAGMAELVVDGRLDANSLTAWYLLADANAFDTIEVAYLDGNDTPYIEEQTGWTSDGVEMKVRIDAAAAPLESRTMHKSNGA